MKYSNKPVCPEDGESLAVKNEGSTVGPRTWKAGDLFATCPKCGRRWVQRMVLDWEEVPPTRPVPATRGGADA